MSWMKRAAFCVIALSEFSAAHAVVPQDVPWWNSGFGRREALTVPGGSTGLAAGQWVSYTFNHAALVSAGRSQADGDDVRIVSFDGGTNAEIGRFLDEASAWNSTTTKLWFRVRAAIAAGASDSNYFLYSYSPAAAGPAIDTSPHAIFKSVQTGTAASSATGTTAVAITPIDPAKSFLVFQTRHNSNRPVGSSIRGRISGATEIQFDRVTDETSTLDIRWYVVEFSNGVRVQRGQTSQAATINSVTLAPVASVEQAFVLWSKTSGASEGTFNSDDGVVAELTSTTTLQLRTQRASAAHTIQWEVVEFTNPADLRVQKGVLTALNNTTTASATAPLAGAVNVNRTFLLASYTITTTDSTGNIGARMIRARLPDGSTVAIDRSITTNNSLPEVVWQAVEFLDGASVQGGTASFAGGAAQSTVALATEVEPARSVALGSIQEGGGQNMGRSPYASDDVPGVGSATLSLSPTRVTFDRTGTADGCDIGWFVIQFADSSAVASSAGPPSVPPPRTTNHEEGFFDERCGCGSAGPGQALTLVALALGFLTLFALATICRGGGRAL